jgi:hypothetical protein
MWEADDRSAGQGIPQLILFSNFRLYTELRTWYACLDRVQVDPSSLATIGVNLASPVEATYQE